METHRYVTSLESLACDDNQREHSSVSFHHSGNCDLHQPRYDTTVPCAKMCKVFPKTCRPCCKYKAVAVSYSLPLGASSEWDSLVSPARGGLMVIFRGKLLHMEANGATVINSTPESEWIELETNWIYSVHLLMTNKSIYIYIYINIHVYIYISVLTYTFPTYYIKKLMQFAGVNIMICNMCDYDITIISLLQV